MPDEAISRQLRYAAGGQSQVGNPPRVAFANQQTAEEILRRLDLHLQGVVEGNALLAEAWAALSGVASPDRALLNLERFVQAASAKPEILSELAGNPRALQMCLTLFAGSQFLTEILLRNPQLVTRLGQPAETATPKGFDQMQDEASAAVLPFTRACSDDLVAALDALRRYQKRELLRIGMGDLNGLVDLSSVTAQLSCLADAVVRISLRIISSQEPRLSSGLAILALGKLGGVELNYSSDIDLLFLARSDATACTHLAEQVIGALSGATREGFLYRVDVRLRPWGSAGPLVTTMAGHLSYLRRHARLWEKQALLKGRTIAGDEQLGEEFLVAAGPLLFEHSPEQARADIYAMKQRTEEYLRQAGREWGEVKLGEGSIRDVEFVTQYLQLVHGRLHPDVRGGNTLVALSKLIDANLLPESEYRILADGYLFLRTVEHYLQILDYRQTHTLPTSPVSLNYLAHRLGFGTDPGAGGDAAARLISRFDQHSAAVRGVFMHHLAGVDVMRPDFSGSVRAGIDVDRHVARLTSSYAATFTSAEIERHAEMAASLSKENPVEIEAAPLVEGGWRLTIVGYDYLGELSVICGLLFVYGFSIVTGNVFTYDVEPEPAEGRAGGGGRAETPEGLRMDDGRRKIVDTFVLRPTAGAVAPGLWAEYSADLIRLIRRLDRREQREAQGELAKRAAGALRSLHLSRPMLYPIEIEIDNKQSDRYTTLHIETTDTVGFLYEFTNALTLNGIYIAQVVVSSFGSRVRDVLYVTDAQGRKIDSPEKQRELRAATVLVKHFTHLLPLSPDPESALMHFHEYLGQLFRRPSWPDDLASLERLDVLEALARLLGVSNFLWGDFLRMQYANLFPVVKDVQMLAVGKTRSDLETELAAVLLSAPDPAARRERLNAFKDREMFRADMRYILGHSGNLTRFQRELTDLAEIVVSAALAACENELRSQYGSPQVNGGIPSRLSVCALGSTGGREMGFASDIELMFVYTGTGNTCGNTSIGVPEFYEKLVIAMTQTIVARRDGIFDIDLQLRPYGSAGSLAVSFDSFARYYDVAGPAWAYERQALVRLRPVAGDLALGTEVSACRDSIAYGGSAFDLAGMKAMRERQLRHLVTPGTVNAKYGRGALVDLQYLVQALQMIHGRTDVSLRVQNTAEAIAALAHAGILQPADHQHLKAAHEFWRKLIEMLRTVRGNARDLTVPQSQTEESEFLARRLGYNGDQTGLYADIGAHSLAVRETSDRLLG